MFIKNKSQNDYLIPTLAKICKICSFQASYSYSTGNFIKCVSQWKVWAWANHFTSLFYSFTKIFKIIWLEKIIFKVYKNSYILWFQTGFYLASSLRCLTFCPSTDGSGLVLKRALFMFAHICQKCRAEPGV